MVYSGRDVLVTLLDKFNRPRLLLYMEITKELILAVHKLSEVTRSNIPGVIPSSVLFLCFVPTDSSRY